MWTQEKLGEKTGLDRRIIGKIERGELVILDTDTLTRLAGALQLTGMERREFFLAAVMDNHTINRESADPEARLEYVLQVIKALPFPALIGDMYLDIVAANSALLKFLETTPECMKTMAGTAAGVNALRLVFTPETGLRTLPNRKWHPLAVRQIQFFRFTTLRYRTTERFAATLKALRGIRDFRRYWDEIHFEDGEACGHLEFYEHKHPGYGRVKYISVAAPIITNAGELYLGILIPADDRTAQTFAGIVAEAGAKAHCFVPWPEKARGE